MRRTGSSSDLWAELPPVLTREQNSLLLVVPSLNLKFPLNLNLNLLETSSHPLPSFNRRRMRQLILAWVSLGFPSSNYQDKKCIPASGHERLTACHCSSPHRLMSSPSSLESKVKSTNCCDWSSPLHPYQPRVGVWRRALNLIEPKPGSEAIHSLVHSVPAVIVTVIAPQLSSPVCRVSPSTREDESGVSVSSCVCVWPVVILFMCFKLTLSLSISALTFPVTTNSGQSWQSDRQSVRLHPQCIRIRAMTNSISIKLEQKDCPLRSTLNEN